MLAEVEPGVFRGGFLLPSHPQKICENIRANLCNMVHLRGKMRLLNSSVFNLDFGPSVWWHKDIKSWTENQRFSALLLKVAQNLPSVPYMFRSACYRLLFILFYTVADSRSVRDLSEIWAFCGRMLRPLWLNTCSRPTDADVVDMRNTFSEEDESFNWPGYHGGLRPIGLLEIHQLASWSHPDNDWQQHV